jgi:hypothetical protein
MALMAMPTPKVIPAMVRLTPLSPKSNINPEKPTTL